MSQLRSLVPALVLALWSLWLPSEVSGQAASTGTISGRVTDGASGQPIAAAQISIVGTTTGTITTGEGQYSLRGVPAGSITLRVLRVGYSESRQTVSVAAGQTVTLDITLTSVPASLSAVVSTATGAQRRLEVGNAIAQVAAADLVETRPITNVGDLLNGRAAGVTVFGGTQPGAGIRIRIRGQSSLSLSNDPIYIIDGIRMEGTTGSSSVSVGGTTPSRIGDLNPEEIETIEIVRGPSAATLYGTDAANGVVVITTKKGVAGRPQWTYYTEQSAVSDRNDYPTAYTGWRTGTTASTRTTTRTRTRSSARSRRSRRASACRTASRRTTSPRTRTPRRSARPTAISMACRCAAAPKRCATSCTASSKARTASPRCRASRTAS
jgi:TonB-dependent SusC/RagA subfamily outer membrane receptor